MPKKVLPLFWAKEIPSGGCSRTGDSFAIAKKARLRLRLFSPGVHPIDLFGHKPDYTSRPKLTEKLWITAGEALFTEGCVVF